MSSGITGPAMKISSHAQIIKYIFIPKNWLEKYMNTRIPQE